MTRLRGRVRLPSTPRPTMALAVGALLMVLIAGCSQKTNPAFPLTRPEAQRALKEMEAAPAELPRPVVVLGGWSDPGLSAGGLRRQIERISAGNQPVISVSFFGEDTWRGCHRHLMDTIAAEIGDRDLPDQHVDVVAFSMGGLVARYAAQPFPADTDHASAAGDADKSIPRLRIARLFTISTPHRGAKAADWPTWDPLVRRMRGDGAFINRLNDRLPEANYVLTPYVRLDDGIVGPANAAPPDQTPWWVDKPPFAIGHLGSGDNRIRADIARRLRGEPPFTTYPPAPLPEQ